MRRKAASVSELQGSFALFDQKKPGTASLLAAQPEPDPVPDGPAMDIVDRTNHLAASIRSIYLLPYAASRYVLLQRSLGWYIESVGQCPEPVVLDALARIGPEIEQAFRRQGMLESACQHHGYSSVAGKMLDEASLRLVWLEVQRQIFVDRVLS